MQILNKDNKKFEVKPENLEDLWVLSEIINPGDRVFSTTKRKVKIGNDKTKQVTKIIFVELLVENSRFENNILKISGKIQNETEFTSIGQFHTLNFDVNNIIKFEKKNFPFYQEKLLNKSVEQKKGKYLLILVDKDELVLAEFNQFNYTILFSKGGLGEKKYIKEKIDELEQKYKLIVSNLEKDYNQIILAGPGFEKEKLKKYIKDKKGIDSIVYQWHDVSTSSVQKLIKELSKKGILEENQLSKEQEIISTLLKNISLGKLYAYGENKTYEKILEGSVEKLLISTKFIEKKQDENTFSDLNEKMLLVENLKGEVIILNSKHEPGKILDGLSGIGAILRY